MEKIKLSKIEEIFSKMKTPINPWDEDNVKVNGEYTYIISNEGSGYVSYDCYHKGQEIFHKNDGAGDYDFNDELVEDDQ